MEYENYSVECLAHIFLPQKCCIFLVRPVTYMEEMCNCAIWCLKGFVSPVSYCLAHAKTQKECTEASPGKANLPLLVWAVARRGKHIKPV